VGVLEFIPATRATVRLLAEEPEEFAREHGVRLHEVAQSVARQTLEFMDGFPPESWAEWFGYLVVEGESQQLAGVCSFKGPPVEGVAEIAYFTFPGFEGRGIATEMARFLFARAGESPRVSSVIAHTLAERNASTRVLEKIGMTFAGDEEEDGTALWRWEFRLR
jgi:RimJ/RimL family protein N-acetyltransferase